MGTTTEWENIRKALTYQMEVQVKQSGQTCTAGFDFMNATAINTGITEPIDIRQGWQYGVGLGPVSNPANFTHVFTVTNTSTSAATSGSLPWVVNQLNSVPLHTSSTLVQFNITGTPPYALPAISLDAKMNTTFDARTQPGGGRIILSGPSGSTSFYASNCTNIHLIGIEFNSPVQMFTMNGFTLKGNVFNTFSSDAWPLMIHTSNNGVIQGNIFGSNTTLTAQNPCMMGIWAQALNSTQIYGNVFSHHRYNAVRLDNGTYPGNVIRVSSNNYIYNNIIWNHQHISSAVSAQSEPAIYIRSVPANPANLNNRIENNLMNVSPLRVWPYNVVDLIRLEGNSNNQKPSPVIASLVNDGPSNYRITGTAQSGDRIHLYLTNRPSNAADVLKYLGQTIAAGDGTWAFNTPMTNIPPGFSVGATAMDTSFNTSQMFYLTTGPTLTNCTTRGLCFRFTTPVTEVLIPSAVTFGKEFNPVEITQTEANAKILIDNIEDQTQALLSDRLAAVQRSYESCLDRVTESFTVTYRIGTYHHTLYYYDRAGNLMKTVPPRGVAYLAVNTPAALATAKTQYPAHTFVTSYEYNSLGQLVKQTTPDAGVTRYWYNDIGQLRFSQNAQQALDVTYSYTKYDPLGRVTEVGESTGFVEATLKANRNNNQSYPGTGMRQVTRTVYSDAFNHFALPSGLVQENYLRNRVSYSYVDEDGNEGTTTDRSYTVYNYDAHGNVKWLVQKIQSLDNKLFAIHYEYDLLSGNVLKVKYNPGESDQFYHRYEYDADNRIRAMYTSADQVVWERDARYDYYLHGPLKRTTVGEDHVQGTDYTYTIHGWLKGLNNPFDLQNANFNTATDPGADGAAGKLTAKDAFGMVLTYYNNDYKHTGHPLHVGAVGLLAPLAGRDLYNGNIAAWTGNVRLPVAQQTAVSYGNRSITGQVYTYDELNRIKSNNFRFWNSGSYGTTTEFQETLQYDANGNISSLLRYGAGTSTNLDNVTPVYYANTNKMSHWPDVWTSPTFDKDVEPQAANYYTYDANGNLKTEGTASTLHWTPYGKVKQVVRTGVGTMDYKYDAAGNRVAKRRANLAGLVQTSYYVRDASGNILAEYEKIEQGANPVELYLNERSLYGSDRVGLYTKRVTISGAAGSTVPLEPGETRISATTQKNAYEGVNYLLNAGASLTLLPGFTYTAPAAGTGQSLSVRVSENTATSPPAGIYSRELNMRQYEMKDHLGNVRALVSDVKLSTLTANVPGNYEPDLKMIANYYAFGMDQPGRQWTSSGKYRYGFNGKEKDDNGEWGQTSYDYGFRIYNPALGRFLSIDPLTKEYPWYTPYQFAGNTPIQAIDLDGLEKVVVTKYDFLLGIQPKLKKSEWYQIEDKTDWESFSSAAEHNTGSNNPGAYQSIEDRHNWYVWASKNVEDNYWFSAAANVTSWSMVGGAEIPGSGIFMSKDAKSVLVGANKFLLKENFKNFGRYALGEGPVTWGNESYEGLSGADLDNQMVVIEMTTLQRYLDAYKSIYIKKNGQEEWKSVESNLNSLFANKALKQFTPNANKYAQDEFVKKFGENTPFNFMNLEHRIFQGQKMAEYDRNNNKK
jgi:RHS repeat-associated protein